MKSPKSKEKRPVGPLFFSGVLIFFSGGYTAAKMALCLVAFQNVFDFRSHTGIQFKEPFGDIFMYGGLTDPELFRGRAHRGVGADNILR